MDNKLLYAVDYIRRAFVADVIGKPDAQQSRHDDYEVLISLNMAHESGGAAAARKVWNTVIQHQRPELARWHLMLRDLYTADQLSSIPKMRYAIDGYAIYENAFNLLVGERGTGKSFFGVDIASRYAQTGKKVLYIAAEGAATYNPRLTAWHDYYNAPPPRMYFWGRAVNTGDKSAFDAWTETIFKGIGPDMVIVDTVARCMVGMDENSSTDMKKFVAAWDELRAMGATILLIHHTNRSGYQRGSGVLDDAADSVLMLRRQDGVLVVRNDFEGGGKNKGSTEAEPLYFKIQPHEVGAFTGDDAAAVLVKTERQSVDLGEVDSLSVSQVNILDALVGIEEGMTANELMDLLNTSRAIYRQLKDLTAAGYLKKQAAMYTLTDKGQTALNSNQGGSDD